MQEVCSAGTVTLEIWGERGEDMMKKHLAAVRFWFFIMVSP